MGRSLDADWRRPSGASMGFLKDNLKAPGQSDQKRWIILNSPDMPLIP